MKSYHINIGSQNRKRLHAKDDEYDSDTELDENKWEERVDRFFSDFPLLVLFVSHLPRNALVEVEFNSLGKSLGNLFPDVAVAPITPTGTLTRNHFHCSSSFQVSDLFSEAALFPHPSLGEIGRPSPKTKMMSIPIWNIGLRSSTRPILLSSPDQLSQQKILPEELCNRINLIKEVALNLTQDATTSYSTFIDGTFVPSCLAIGYLLISGSEPEISSSSSLLLICIALFQEIYQNVIEKKIMKLSDLKTIKIFYPSYICSFDEINAAVADAFDVVMTSREISLQSSLVQLIPTLEGDSSQSHLLRAQFIFLNFLQMKAELWIGSTDGR